MCLFSCCCILQAQKASSKEIFNLTKLLACVVFCFEFAEQDVEVEGEASSVHQFPYFLNCDEMSSHMIHTKRFIDEHETDVAIAKTMPVIRDATGGSRNMKDCNGWADTGTGATTQNDDIRTKGPFAHKILVGSSFTSDSKSKCCQHPPL